MISLKKANWFLLIGFVVLNEEIIAQARGTSTIPVMFDNVNITMKGDGVLVEWSNLTEREVVSYVVERSGDAHNYKELANLLPASNRNEPMHYATTVPVPSKGLNYYRIKVNELSGKVIFSKVLKIDNIDNSDNLVLYPNPVTNGQLNWTMSGLTAGSLKLAVVSMSGVPVYQQTISITGKAVTQSVNLPYSIPGGMYKLMLTDENTFYSKTFIVQ